MTNSNYSGVEPLNKGHIRAHAVILLFVERLSAIHSEVHNDMDIWDI